jgi:hypothetical protein
LAGNTHEPIVLLEPIPAITWYLREAFRLVANGKQADTEKSLLPEFLQIGRG